MPFKEERYRLRNGNQIIGYLRKVYGGAYFYSKDSYWWTGREINYEEIDEWTGYKDINRKLIYEWDILQYRLDKDEPFKTGAVLWQKKNQHFGIRDLNEEIFFPLNTEGFDLFQGNDLKVISQLYLNPEILEMWGL